MPRLTKNEILIRALTTAFLLSLSVTIVWVTNARRRERWIDRCLVGMHFRGEPMAGAKDVCEAKWRLRGD